MAVTLFHLTVPCPAARATWDTLGRVTDVRSDGPRVTLRCGEAAVQLVAMDEHVVRVRLAPDGEFGRDFSWAVLDLTPRGRFTVDDVDADPIQLSTGALRVSIRRDPCRLEILDGDGHRLVADDSERGMGWGGPAGDGVRPVRVWQTLSDDFKSGAAIYGLGEKVGPLSKRGRAWTMWNTDAAAYGPHMDPLYKSIPLSLPRRTSGITASSWIIRGERPSTSGRPIAVSRASAPRAAS